MRHFDFAILLQTKLTFQEATSELVKLFRDIVEMWF